MISETTENDQNHFHKLYRYYPDYFLLVLLKKTYEIISPISRSASGIVSNLEDIFHTMSKTHTLTPTALQ